MDTSGIRFGDVRKYIFSNLGVCSDQPSPFLYAYHTLTEHPEQICTDFSREDSLPDFMQWDLSDPDFFAGLIDRIPVREQEKELTPMKPYSADSSLLYLPSAVPFFIGRELPCTRMTPHIDDCFTILYVYQGSCVLRINDTDHPMRQGEMCIISPHTVRCHTLGKEDFVIGILIHRPVFEHSLFKALGRNNTLAEFFRNVLFRSEKGHLFFVVPPSPDICQILQHLFQEYTHRDSYSLDLFEQYLDILFTLLMRNHEHTYRYYSGEHMPVFVALPHILSYIQNHFSTLTMEKLAEKFHYDRSYLSRQLRRYTGKSYTGIIADCRLEKAKEYLCFTDMKISDIAARTGFHSGDHFTRFFRKETGTSPREYRKSHITFDP